MYGFPFNLGHCLHRTLSHQVSSLTNYLQKN